MSRFWVGVASRDHVLKAVNGGFCQLNHGREAPVQKLQPGDRILYYSSRERMHEGAVLQAFTAAGEVIENEIYRVDSEAGFRPYRRNVRYPDVGSASGRCCQGCPSRKTTSHGGRFSGVAVSRSARRITV
jgi:hypothetical protein